MRVIAYYIVLFAAFTLPKYIETKSATTASNSDDSKSFIQNHQSYGEDQHYTNCQVHKNYSIESWQGEPLRFLAFVDYEERLSASMGFKHEHMSLVYDQIILSQKEIKLCTIRNGIVNKTTLDQYLDTAGWTWFEISMSGKQFILKYENTTALNYTVDQPVKELIVHGSNITVCKYGSPTWILKKGHSAVIPLEPSRQAVNPFIEKTHVLTLHSNDDFTPCIMIDGNNTCLGHEDNGIITLANTSKTSPIPLGKWDLYLELVPGSLNINQQINGVKHYITGFPKERIQFIEVTSNNSKFSVSLNVFVQPDSSSDGARIEYDRSTTRLPNDTSVDNGLLNGVIIGIASCAVALAVLIIGYWVIKKQMISFPWKKPKMDEPNKDSTNQHSVKNYDEKKALV